MLPKGAYKFTLVVYKTQGSLRSARSAVIVTLSGEKSPIVKVKGNGLKRKHNPKEALRLEGLANLTLGEDDDAAPPAPPVAAGAADAAAVAAAGAADAAPVVAPALLVLIMFSAQSTTLHPWAPHGILHREISTSTSCVHPAHSPPTVPCRISC